MKLSIITVNLNNLEGLKKTYESVVCQTFTDYEWLVIDGGSTDGSREFIEQHQDKFAYWCSEPDKGIYNAMNKGIVKAKGEYLNFMNSGDCFASSFVVASTCARLLPLNPYHNFVEWVVYCLILTALFSLLYLSSLLLLTEGARDMLRRVLRR